MSEDVMAVARRAFAEATGFDPANVSEDAYAAVEAAVRAALQARRPAGESKVLAALRQPFGEDQIGHKPQLWCKACSANLKQGKKGCENHAASMCPRCKQKVTEAHNCISFVGHADATERLLDVDPQWSWEPAHKDVDPQVLAAACASGNPEIVQKVIDNAPPLYDRTFNGMWMKIVVHMDDGTPMTRLGFGDAQGKEGGNAIKEIVGDGIRNAGMRGWGMALDLWKKGDRERAEARARQNGDEARYGEKSPFDGAAAGEQAPGTPRRPAPQRRQVKPATDEKWLEGLRERWKAVSQQQATSPEAWNSAGKIWREIEVQAKAGKCGGDDKNRIQRAIRQWGFDPAATPPSGSENTADPAGQATSG